MSIHEKMIQFHAQFSGVKKTGFNPHFKSQHFTLDEIVHVTTPILNELGLYIAHQVGSDGNGPAMITSITGKDGESISSSFPMSINTNPQAMGSAVTYYKRYNLCALLNIAEADDDGNAAAAGAETNVKPQAKYVPEDDGSPATPEQHEKIKKIKKKGNVPIRFMARLEQLGDDITFAQAAKFLAAIAAEQNRQAA